jgi:cell division protein FtsQ
MQRLTANPDSRIRSSELFLPSETAFPARPQDAKGLVSPSIVVIGFALAFTAIVAATFREDGQGDWYNWIVYESKKLVSSVSVESGLVVQEFSISGNRVVPSKVFLESVGIEIGAPMILVDLRDALEVVTRVDWVDSAQVSRQWPNKISIKVVEKAPVAIWETPEGPLFIDERGEVFGDKYMEMFPDLPILRGAGADHRFPELRGVLERSPVVGAEFIGATLLGKRRWDIKMTEGLIVRLPEDEMERAWILFSNHLKRGYLALEGLAVADYTLVDRLVLQFEEVTVKQSGNGIVGLTSLNGRLKESYARGSVGPG